MRPYKDSGIEWIGKIPETWELKRLKSQLIEIKEKNYPLKTDKVLSLTIKDGVIPYEEKGDVGNKSKENHEEYKLAYPNTIVLNSMNILIGAVGISNYYGCVSPVYYVFKNRESADLRFINYIMSSTPFQKYLRKYANGILEIRLRISAEDILKRQIPTPCLIDQQRIADYLDTKCGEIDSLIGLQEQMIEKLKAYKQSVITEAVTKGLDPNAKLVPSGIDWIGEIPEGWKVCRFKSYIHLHNEKGSESVGFKVNLENIESKSGRYLPTESKYEGEGTSFKKGDVLFGKLRPYLAKVYAPETDGSAIGDIYVFRPLSNIDTLFLKYTLLADTFVAIVDSSTYGTKMPRANWEFISCVPIVVPPLSEQRSIAAYLNQKCADIDRLIALKQQKIEALKDYKKSVIYEAVTGKTEI